MTYWKVPNREQFYSTFIDDDKDEVMLQFLHEFLVEECYDDDSGKFFIKYKTGKQACSQEGIVPLNVLNCSVSTV